MKPGRWLDLGRPIAGRAPLAGFESSQRPAPDQVEPVTLPAPAQPEVGGPRPGAEPQVGERSVPILIYHQVRPLYRGRDTHLVIQPQTFTRQMRYLQENGYHCATLEEVLEQRLGSIRLPSRSVVLTFDDATADHWSYVFPILKRFGFRATFFVPTALPGEGPLRPNWDDVEANRASEAELPVDGVMSWTEIAHAERSGVARFESHSHFHARHSCGPRVVGFLTPRDTEEPEKWGTAVYEDASALVRPRFFCVAAEAEAARSWVSSHGGAAFFERDDWRDELLDRIERFRQQTRERGHFESEEDYRARIDRELRMTRQRFFEQLGRETRFLAWPYGELSEELRRIALRVGFRATVASTRTGAGAGLELLSRQHFGADYDGPLRESVHYWRFVKAVEAACGRGWRHRLSPVVGAFLRRVGEDRSPGERAKEV